MATYMIRTGSDWCLNSHDRGFIFKSKDPEECAMYAFGCGEKRVYVMDGAGRTIFSMTPTGSKQFCFYEITCGECNQWRTTTKDKIRQKYPDFGWGKQDHA